MELRIDGADGRINLNATGPESPEVGEGNHEADRAVAAHAEDADIVEKDNAEIASGAVRRDEEGADDGVGAAGLVDDGGTVGVEVAAEPRGAFVEPVPRSGPPSRTRRSGSPPV